MTGEFSRTTFGGFNRKEVLAYIEQMDEQANENKNTLEKQLETLSNKSKEIEKENSNLKGKIKNLEEELSKQLSNKYDTIQENDDLKEKCKQLEKSIQESFKKSDEQLDGLDQANERIKQLQKQLDDKDALLLKAEDELKQAQSFNGSVNDKMQELEEKSEKYDDFTYQLGEVFLDAHKRADSVLGFAVSQAEKLAGSTNDSAKEIIEDFMSLEKNIQDIRSCVNTSMDVMNKQLDKLTKELESVINRLKTGIPTKYEVPKQEVQTPDYIEKAMADVSSHNAEIKNKPNSNSNSNSNPNPVTTNVTLKKNINNGKSSLFEGLFHHNDK